MMQATDLRNSYDPSIGWLFYLTTSRRITIQRHIRLRKVVVLDAALQNSPQMFFVQYGDVIQTFAANGTDYTLGTGILPG